MKKFKFSESVLVFVVLSLVGMISSCPIGCTCKWKGGKQTVECVNLSLRTFPTPIDPGTQVLDLGGNSFETLPSDHFMILSLINLQKIYLQRSRISHIDFRSFRGLTNLVDLDLSFNLLREVPTPALSELDGLMRLILSGNPILTLKINSFGGLVSLTTLEITHAGIEIIEKGAFDGLPKLEWLKLNSNKLKKFEGASLLPPSLKGVWLGENPWECDCKLLELRLFLAERNVGSSSGAKCASPQRLLNGTIKELTTENFACLPQMSPTTMYQKISEGKNVSLLCKIISTPEASIDWYLNGELIFPNSSTNIFIDTISPSSTQPHSPSETKSELMVLNATLDENGTFLCVAKNAAGNSYANFTLRVLPPHEIEESYTEAVGIFVSSLPNLFIVSITALGLVVSILILFLTSYMVCKCRKKSPGANCAQLEILNNKFENGEIKGENGQLSETSTFSTNLTKSTNGSLFHLNGPESSEGKILEPSDSNPDLIEGVNSKISNRVDADGAVGENSYFTIRPNSDYGLPLPPNNNLNSLNSYDLAKYPKEYLTPNYSCHNSPHFYGNYAGYDPNCAPYPIIYNNAPSPSPYQFYTNIAQSSHLSYNGYGTGCSCTPIAEESENCENLGKISDEARGIFTNKSTEKSSAVQTDEEIGLKSILKNSSSEKSPRKNNEMKNRLQRHLSTQINESPDEGYEDEAPEIID